MSEKVYVPKCSARARDTKYGEMINVSFDVDALVAFAGQHGNAKGRLNLTLSRRKEPGKYGETHSVTLDTFEPTRRMADPASDGSDGDMPF